jgi:hypothetical protein
VLKSFVRRFWFQVSGCKTVIGFGYVPLTAGYRDSFIGYGQKEPQPKNDQRNIPEHLKPMMAGKKG